MPVFGNLTTMSLPDLLQWAAMAQKTGVLEIERNGICRGIEFRKGFIGACSSDDPSNRIGQVLLSRGKIRAEHLTEALTRQEQTGQNLCVILIDLGALTQEDVARFIATKAEETIHSLFDWEDAIFRFYEGATLDSNLVEVSLTVNDILLKGLQHRDELKLMRGIFKTSGIVLKRSDRAIPDELMSNQLARRILGQIDGIRTISEILLHSHTSEFLAVKLLYRLHQTRLVKIMGDQPVSSPTILDPPEPSFMPQKPSWKPPAVGTCPPQELLSVDGIADSPGAEIPSAAPTLPGENGPNAEIAVADRLMQRGEYGAAMELLGATSRAHPGNDQIRDLISTAELSFVEASRITISPDRIPIFLKPTEQIDKANIGPDAAYLVSLIDGKSDIKSMLWLAPMSEMETLRALQRMVDMELIALKDPADLHQDLDAVPNII